MIVKNENLRLEECLKLWRPYVQEICICDTGSTDSTVEIAKKYADKVITFISCNDSEGRIEDFSMARNKSFSMATQPWVIWSDGDDLIRGVENLYEIIKETEGARTGRPAMVLFKYEYAHDERGNVRVSQYRERLFSNTNQFIWQNKIHETCVPLSLDTFTAIREEVVWVHNRTDKIIEPERNLRIMKKVISQMEESNAIDARQYYYGLLEHFNHNEIEEALKLGEKYLKLSGWDDEKFCCATRVGQYYLSVGKYEKAIEYAFKAVSYQECWAEAYLMLSKAFYLLAETKDPHRNYQRCVHFAELGLSYPETKTLLFVDPMDRAYEIHKFLNVAYSKLNETKKALDSCIEGLKANPDDPWMQANKKIYQRHLLRLDFNKKVTEMLTEGTIDQPTYDALMLVLDGPPVGTASPQPVVSAEINGLMVAEWVVQTGQHVHNSYLDEGKVKFELSERIKNDKPLDIIFYMGDGLETITPASVARNGCGASETLLIEISKRFANKGNKVRVYGGVGDGEGIYEGVEYRKSNAFQNLKCDVLIVSRQANMLDDTYNVQADLKILWCHDVIAVGATNKLLLKADRIFALTEWHKINLMNAHNIGEDHVIKTRNGISLERFDKSIPRNRYKVINSSSPDRSWISLFDCWKEIKYQVPQAELHLYYGLENLWKVAQWNPAKAQEAQMYLDKIQELKDFSVHFHGRVPQSKLADEFLSAGVLAYPTDFTETFSCVAAEAQAAGLRIVTTKLAGLIETVGNRGVLIDGNCHSPEYKEQFIKKVVAALQKETDEDRKDLQKYAKENFGLNELVDNWDHLINELIIRKKQHPCVKFKPINGF